MIGLIDSWDVEYNGTENEALFKLVCDSAAELSSLTHYDNIKIRIGSECTDIATGDKYLKSSSAWVMQPQSMFANVYTKAEVDSMYSTLYQTMLYYHTTQTSTDGTITFYAFVGFVGSLTIYGNGSQSGTPTPDNPVTPTFCGVRTANLANLWSVDSTFLNLHYTTGSAMTISISGTKTNGNNVHSIATPNIILPAGKYTVKIKMIGGTITGLNDGVFFGINKDTYSKRTTPAVKAVGEVGTRTFTLSDDTLITSLDLAPGYGNSGTVFTDATFECGLYAGSSAPDDYEPYGWAEKITCAGQTVPVYLGQTQTVRRIRKLVLTGDETYAKQSGESLYSYNLPTGEKAKARDLIMCSHLPFSKSYSTTISINIYSSLETIFLNFGTDVMDTQPSGNTVAGLKEYLAAQYAAGTPVTVWYVLATEQTRITNEPLCKIGDYADELHSTDAGVTIPTAKGSNTLTVDTTLKPCKIEISGER